MVWQEQTEVIVMLTNEVEQGRPKCDRYWPGPPNAPEHRYGSVHVRHVETQAFPKYVVRRFELSAASAHVSKPGSKDVVSDDSNSNSNNNSDDDERDSSRKAQAIVAANLGDVEVLAANATASRIVVQYHFTAWPDHGVPSTTKEMLDFRAAVCSAHRDGAGPVIVHCSAGVGRTGTCVLLFICCCCWVKGRKLTVFFKWGQVCGCGQLACAGGNGVGQRQSGRLG
jgi:protein tyrosine phosphatase